MPRSILDPEFKAVFEQARQSKTRTVNADGKEVEIQTPFPSPDDWRDQWIYFILTDRFNNPNSPPNQQPWDKEHWRFQGGVFEGVRQKLGYLQDLGVGAVWLSPALKNCQYHSDTYHGYGIQDFLSIDPRFASDPEAAKENPQLVEDELRSLVDEAHARGIYVIFDVVLNHVGDIFEYAGYGRQAPWNDQTYEINWRDENGQARPDWTEAPADSPPNGSVWPVELQRNEYLRRKGRGGELGGDFDFLKELVTDYRVPNPVYGVYYPVRDILIRAYQYLIAKFDPDGFRIDTLKYIERDFARLFGNAMREFALSIGKKEFFTFGEVYDNEEKISSYIGRDTMTEDELIGVDAALDFPLFYKLPDMAKGLIAPSQVVQMYNHRKQVQRTILSSHGDASKYFVTFLDNHDQYCRFRTADSYDLDRYDDQVVLGLGCLFALQGIPCLYYGTEQGMHGNGTAFESVREALWGKQNAFDAEHPFYKAIRQLAEIRRNEPALRYGRQYFRPISGDGENFGISDYPGGMLACSRILNDQEILFVANTNTRHSWNGGVIVDYSLNPTGSKYRILFSNKEASQGSLTDQVEDKVEGSITVEETNGKITHGPTRMLPLSLMPMEFQILKKDI